MANTLYVERVEMRPIGSNEGMTYGVQASDSYAKWSDMGFISLDELNRQYPNRMAVMKAIKESNEFYGSLTIDSDKKVTLKSMSNIRFDGFPDEDDSIADICKENGEKIDWR